MSLWRCEIQRRPAQYGFKVWLALSMGLAVVIPLTADKPKTAEWRLYYGLITVAIVIIERVVRPFSPPFIKILMPLEEIRLGEH